MADPPAASDPWWPAIRDGYTLLLQTIWGSSPAARRAFHQRARALARAVPFAVVAEHFQCLHTETAAIT